MAQLHLYVSDEVAERIRKRAGMRGLSVSRFLASLVTRDVGSDWPDLFFEKVVGGWQGRPLERPPQGEHEDRDGLSAQSVQG